MRISEELLSQDSHGPWSVIAKSCARRFKRTTGNSFDGEWLEIAAYAEHRPDSMERVEWGFARRAVQQMRTTCSVCGTSAKRLPSIYRGSVRCPACQLPVDFHHELDFVLRDDDDPSGEQRLLWIESHVPPLVRMAIPGHIWRRIELTKATHLRYVDARDLQRLAPGLARLAALLDEDAERRAARLRTQFELARGQARS